MKSYESITDAHGHDDNAHYEVDHEDDAREDVHEEAHEGAHEDDDEHCDSSWGTNPLLPGDGYDVHEGAHGDDLH